MIVSITVEGWRRDFRGISRRFRRSRSISKAFSEASSGFRGDFRRILRRFKTFLRGVSGALHESFREVEKGFHGVSVNFKQWTSVEFKVSVYRFQRVSGGFIRV